MLVIICLLEDEQELSLGMLIRPKRIYNFCHVLLELLYTFEPIWTNLLTQCTQLPVPVFCCFCISGFPAIKSAQKIPGKYIKNQRDATFRSNQERQGGPPPGDQEDPWRGPTLGRAGSPPAFLVGPPNAPLRLYFPVGVETPNPDPFFTNAPMFGRRRHFKTGAAGEAAPAPC